eukprot:CAMPEP_0113499908 /NCGR_PEP_ID=MMETSP0014_2-20120614/32012_1 /TAXON_ID=2857 /ORGANISM="Nitzschia sp." /LENGTH=398 /DNA_ID=CAMNT_0000394141 /DNA_START=172 /DNA_END=1368 /DNA_ORIENTATION=+ /assembly_acc=CAM_ASM_000159
MSASSSQSQQQQHVDVDVVRPSTALTGRFQRREVRTTNIFMVLLMMVVMTVVPVDAFSTHRPVNTRPSMTTPKPSPTTSSPFIVSSYLSASTSSSDDDSSESSTSTKSSIVKNSTAATTPTSSATLAVTTATSAAAIAAVALLVNPASSYAAVSSIVDPASIVSTLSLSGGTAATSAQGFLSSLVETGFWQAFSLVFVSEIGDKTFFIAGLLAMKTSKLQSFLGSMGALIVMTLISVVIGQAFHAVPSGFLGDGKLPLDDVAAVIAFAFFGFKTLKEALDMDEEGTSFMDEELAEAEEEVEESDATRQNTALARILSIFGLVFAAEFGDRSFLSTIALSAAQNPVSVAAGAIAAHAVATGIAVSGGAVAAKYLSEKVIGIIGGSLFIVFAVTTALGIF